MGKSQNQRVMFFLHLLKTCSMPSPWMFYTWYFLYTSQLLDFSVDSAIVILLCQLSIVNPPFGSPSCKGELVCVSPVSQVQFPLVSNCNLNGRPWGWVAVLSSPGVQVPWGWVPFKHSKGTLPWGGSPIIKKIEYCHILDIHFFLILCHSLVSHTQF